MAVGVRYIAFLIINLITLRNCRESYKSAILFFLATVFFAYFLRGLVVVTDHSLFTFAHIYEVNNALILQSFDSVLLGTIGFCIGFIILSKRTTTTRRLSVDHRYSIIFLRLFWFVWIFLLSLALLKIALVLGAGVGKKGMESSSPFSALLALIPLDLPFLLIVMYFTKYYKKLSLVRKLSLVLLSVIYAYSMLIIGSKAFVMIFAFCYVAYLLYTNYRLSLVKFSFLAAALAVVTTISFAASQAVKYSFYFENLSNSEVIGLGYDILKESDGVILFNEVTARFNGFDGELKYIGLQQPKESKALADLKPSFAPSQIMLRVVGGVIPLVQLSSTLNCGTAVARFAEKVPASRSQASALGLMSASKVLAGHFYFLFLLLLGAVSASYFKLVNFIANPDLKFIFYFFGVFFLFNLTMSGNFDALIIRMIWKVGILAVGLPLLFSLRHIVLISSPTTDLQRAI
jgi:hypothetical protein